MVQNILEENIESIVDNLSQDEHVEIIINFKDEETQKALASQARLAEMCMFGGIDTLPDAPHDTSESIQRRPASRAVKLRKMKRRNTSHINKLSRHVRQNESEGISAPRSRNQSTALWLSNALATRLNREQIASLRDNNALIRSVTPDNTIEAPDFIVTSTQNTADEVSWGLSYVNAPEAWITGARGRGVKISVVDTGIARHPALNNVVLASEAQFVRQNGRDVLSQYVDLPRSSDRGDGMGHGTHVAGTIGGTTNNGNFIGIAPEVELMSASVFNGRTTTNSAILQGLQWSVENGADIINMSLGAFDLSRWVGNYDTTQPNLGAWHDTFNSAIINANRAGALVVVAIGNDGAGTSKTPGSCISALTVGAMAKDGRCAGFSGGAVLVYHADGSYRRNYIKPDVSAPGVNIKSTDQHGYYTTASGTSMATPCVSGVAALVLSSSKYIKALRDPYHRAIMLKYIITYSASHDLGEWGSDTRFGQGVSSAQAAVKLGHNDARLDQIYTRLMNSGLFD